ncbi:MAG: molybdopterin converting factor subunit 1 [Pseudomonadales bacterium]|nr:molybdopterin converting factor subunit 1 [Pseudomonadales bacterium]
MIKVVLFASVKEAVGVPSIEVEPKGGETVVDIVEQLSKRGESWRSALTAENLLFAVNQTLVSGSHPVDDGDEVAVLPPVTGG